MCFKVRQKFLWCSIPKTEDQNTQVLILKCYGEKSNDSLLGFLCTLADVVVVLHCLVLGTLVFPVLAVRWVGCEESN